ncbi:MAG: S46 family peptidase [Bacteroidota bacterium]
MYFIRRIILLALSFSCFMLFARDEEGMWVPVKAGKMVWTRMAEEGFTLDSNAVFQASQPSLKDAVLLFGKGCTGSFISGRGLVITNHHCGYDYITKLSTLQKDLLKNGFWASSDADELPCPGLTVSVPMYIRDITETVNQLCPDTFAKSAARENALKNAYKEIERRQSVNGITAVVKPVYAGNQHMLYGYKVYKDVRLVGCPPEASGKFGEESDNWMWPRHTADFALFRVYGDKNFQPAEYNLENQPVIPTQFLEISAKPVREGYPALVMGYPGKTNEYLFSNIISVIEQDDDPIRIEARTERLGIWNSFIRNNDTLKLMYASRFSSIANGWKKWQGEILGLKKSRVVERRMSTEKNYAGGPHAEAFLPMKSSLEKHLSDYIPLNRFRLKYNEVFMGIDAFAFSDKMAGMAKEFLAANDSLKDAQRKKMETEIKRFFKEFSPRVDRAVFMKFFPDFFQFLKKHPSTGLIAENKIFLPSPESIAEKIYTSPFLKQDTLIKWLEKPEKACAKILKNDLVLFTGLVSQYYRQEVEQQLIRVEGEIGKINRQYQAFLLKYYPDSIRYPDANGTLRFSFGKVRTYSPRNGVQYHYATTTDGILEKYLSGVADYTIDSMLYNHLKSQDFGNYSPKGQALQTCFISTCHTTGGNSGSPVLNASGQMFAINFDRCWEGTMSDLEYDSSFCRNIMLNMRYALFYIDKIGKAERLLREMKIQWQ